MMPACLMKQYMDQIKYPVRQIPKKESTHIDAFGVEVKDEQPNPRARYFGNVLETDADIMQKLKGTVFNP